MTKAQTSLQPFCGLQTEQRRQASDPFAAGACSYAQALLAREAAVQSLQQRMWQEEVAESAVQGQAARMRRAAAEEEEREAVRELDRVQAEGPANHRKRDPIDKARRDSCRDPWQQQGQGLLHLSAGALMQELLFIRVIKDTLREQLFKSSLPRLSRLL